MSRSVVLVALVLALAPSLGQSQTTAPARTASSQCGFNESSALLREHIQKLRTGALPSRRSPAVSPGRGPSGPQAVSPDDIFAYEDSASLLLTNFSFDDLEMLMVDAANALMLAHGDSFDFVGFFLNFTPDHTIGAAFYSPIENDINGVGDMGGFLGLPNPTFNLRSSLGLGGNNIEGFVMMWNVFSWTGGAGGSATFTRLVLAQEFEHRFALFLPPLLDGRVMQGDDNICGRSAHWNWQVDGQGSGMEISEWTGSSPALPTGLFVNFNTDIPGGVFSYSDLYLMGYVTPAEMDAGNSELRFMQGSDCSSNFNGTISTFGSADLIAAAGPRVPSSASEDKDYRTGWVMFHLPGQAPGPTARNHAAGILNQHTADWSTSTLGRGTMDNTLPPIVASVPVMGGFGLALFALSVLGGGGWLMRRRRA